MKSKKKYLTIAQKITKRTYRKYRVSESDADIIEQIKFAMKDMGYNWRIILDVEKLMYRDYCSKHTCPKCRKCGEKLYVAILDKPVGRLPNGPICVGCIKNSRLKMFKPKMSLEEAWLKVTS